MGSLPAVASWSEVYCRLSAVLNLVTTRRWNVGWSSERGQNSQFGMGLPFSTGPPSPSISGIINLAANCEIIYGLQSLTDKILSHKGLSTSLRFLLATLAVPSWDKWRTVHKVRCHNALWKSLYPFEPRGNTAIKKCVCAPLENSGCRALGRAVKDQSGQNVE
jgi:hypothetical protein